MIEFFVPGNPQALKRHKAYWRKGMKYPVKIDQSKEDKADFLAKCMEHKPDKPFDCPLELNCNFRFSRPKSHFGTGKNKGVLKKSYISLAKINKPDLDNLVKFVLDSLTGIFWLDDAQVAFLTATKAYSENPGVHIKIEAFG